MAPPYLANAPAADAGDAEQSDEHVEETAIDLAEASAVLDELEEAEELEVEVEVVAAADEGEASLAPTGEEEAGARDDA